MAGKAQDMCQRHTLMGGGEGGSRVRGMARPLLRNFEAKSLYFKQIGRCFLYTTI